MKKYILLLAFAAFFLTSTAQISLSKDIKIQVPKDLKIVNSSTVNKKELGKAKWPLLFIDDNDGSQVFEKDGVILKMFYQTGNLEKDFLQGKEYEFKQLKARSKNYYSHSNYEIKKMNGFSVFISEKERFDDPIGYLMCYGLPNSLNKLLITVVQYKKEDRTKALTALISLLKGVEFI
ncbi:hypothetical protein [Pedobacter sp. JCM 36344]|uniref:hypothetical protein n=1 Tax=Pedobacter sp. JCM 36344 TaxID=3374280 RepID=UPI00397D8285